MSLSTLKRTLRRAHAGTHRDQIAPTMLTIVPIVKRFQDRHDLAEMVVVADTGMLSSSNLSELDEAGLRFIVGSRVTKAPVDLESYFRWNGTAFTDGQIIDTITPRTGHHKNAASNPMLKAEPIWDPEAHPGSWRAVWAYSTKRSVRDSKTLTLQENRAKAVVAGRRQRARRGLSRPATAPPSSTRRRSRGHDDWSG